MRRDPEEPPQSATEGPSSSPPSGPNASLLEVQIPLDLPHSLISQSPGPAQLEQLLSLDADQLSPQLAVVGDPLFARGNHGVLAAEHRLAHAEAGAVEVAQSLQL